METAMNYLPLVTKVVPSTPRLVLRQNGGIE